jgi:hypothetical protein
VRSHPWLFLVLIAGCAARPQAKGPGASASFDQQQALKNLKAQAEEVGRAAVQEDHARRVESTAAEMKGQGFGLKKFTIGEPSQLVQAGGQVYAIVPSELEMSAPPRTTGRQAAYLIAVSPDAGARWQFIDGSGIGGDPRKLKSLLPNFPEELQLPAEQPPAWHKE